MVSVMSFIVYGGVSGEGVGDCSDGIGIVPEGIIDVLTHIHLVCIHAERLVGHQLFLPKSLRVNYIIWGCGLRQELQNRKLKIFISLRIVTEQFFHQLVVAVQRVNVVSPSSQQTIFPVCRADILPAVLPVNDEIDRFDRR